MTRFRLIKDARFYDQTFPAGTECEEADEVEYVTFFADWPPGLDSPTHLRTIARVVHLAGQMRLLMVHEIEVVS
jgi:hypothetical protein